MDQSNRARAGLHRLVLPVAAALIANPGAARTYSRTGEPLPQEVGYLMLGVFAVLALVALGTVLLVVVAKWKIFEKAGRPGWAAIVPIYNKLVMLRMVGRPDWWIVLVFIPPVNLGVSVLLNIDLAKVFDREEIFAVGLILLPFVFYPILAFGDAAYIGPREASGEIGGVTRP
jgi:hypothetical protein